MTNTSSIKEKVLFTKNDLLIGIAFSIIASTISIIINYLGFAEANILLVYILAILFISVNTKGYAIGVIFAFINVLFLTFYLQNLN